jgi:hypothetical protein
MKSILVFSHNHNSFDKKRLLENINQYVTVSDKGPADFVKESEILQFFMEDIDTLLEAYDPGDPKHKPDVLKQIEDIARQREEAKKEYQLKQELMQRANNNPVIQTKMNEFTIMIQELTMENSQLKDKVVYLENKLKQLIAERIQERTKQHNNNNNNFEKDT